MKYTSLTWEKCAAAGMSQSEAAAAMGRSASAGSHYARRHGLDFRRDYRDYSANAERMRALHADPARNPLVLLTPEERADYDILRRAKYSRDEALRSIGRDDLVAP